MDAHERWSYNSETKIQKLERLICLCQDCHEATHMGLAGVNGRGNEARAHLKKVRGFSDEAFVIRRKRSVHNWELDLSLITANGIGLKK